ncbi:MAG: inclusion body family protein [Wenzhouxiangellaceae bacterium]
MSDSNSIIEVLVVVDAASLIQEYGTNTDPQKPVQVTQPELIYMITRQANALAAQASNQLVIAAKTLDVIRWRQTTLSLNSAYTGILYQFEASGGSDLISPPMPLEATVSVPLPNPAAPTKPDVQRIKTYFWNSTVLSPGEVTYDFRFMLVDRQGKIQGYYWWDPYIQISAG